MIPVFDAHTHAYPVAIAGKATDSLSHFYEFRVSGDGTPEDLFRDAQGLLRGFLLFSVATTPHQVTAIDDFISLQTKNAREKGFEAVGFGTMHPDFTDMEAEVERCLSLGLRGIKLHPDIQKTPIDDERLMPLYACAEGRLTLCFHTGDNRYDYSDPVRILRILERFPRLQVIAAHLGTYRLWDREHVLAGHPNVWYDCSSTIVNIGPERAAGLIRKLGADRVFFGSDYPCSYPSEEFRRFLTLPLTESEKNAVLYDNAHRFFFPEANA